MRFEGQEFCDNESNGEMLEDHFDSVDNMPPKDATSDKVATIMPIQASNLSDINAKENSMLPKRTSQKAFVATKESYVNDAIKEITRQKKALESQVDVLHATLQEQRGEINTLKHQLSLSNHNTKKNAHKNNIKESHSGNDDAASLASAHQISAFSALAHRRGIALRQIANLLGGQSWTTTDCDDDRDDEDPSHVVELVMNVCQGILDVEKEWTDEKLRLQCALEKAQEELSSIQLQSTETEVQNALHSMHQLESKAQEVELALSASQHQANQADHMAAEYKREIEQLKALNASLEKRVVEVESRAEAAEREAEALRGSAAREHHRLEEMRCAAATAIEVAENIQNTIIQACKVASQKLEDDLARCCSDNDGIGGPVGPHKSTSLACVESMEKCKTMLKSVSELQITNLEDKAQELSARMCFVVRESSQALVSCHSALQEYSNVYSALLRAIGDGTKNNQQKDEYRHSESSLDGLLAILLDRFSALASEVHNDKSGLETAHAALQADNDELRKQIQSLESVLRSAVHSGPHHAADDALLRLAAAQKRILELEATCAVLRQQLQHAQQEVEDAKTSASQSLSEVRADVAQLVHHAERASRDAERALEQQRIDTAKQVAEARSKEHAASAAKLEIESKLSEAKESIAGLRRDVDAATKAAAAWQARALAAETKANNKTSQKAVMRIQKDREQYIQLSATEKAHLRSRIHCLEGQVANAEAQAEQTARSLNEARSKANIASEAAAGHHATAAAAVKRAQEAESKVEVLQKQVAHLELTLLQQQSERVSMYNSRNGKRSVDTTSNGNNNINSINYHKRQPTATTPPFMLAMPPQDADAGTLRRRLEGALHQIETLRALNTNLEQQLSFFTISDNRPLTDTATVHAEEAEKNTRYATPHEALMDDLHDHMRALGLDTNSNPKILNLDDGHNENNMAQTITDGNYSLENVVSLWRQACESRDDQLATLQHRLRSLQSDLDIMAAENAALVESLHSLKDQVREDSTAKKGLEKEFQKVQSEAVALRGEAAALRSLISETDMLQQRVDHYIEAINILEQRINELESENSEISRALHVERNRAEQASAGLQLAKEAEARVQEAQKRALEAEEALARHLDREAKQYNTSLGQQLERGLTTESELSRRIEQLQWEATRKEVEMQRVLEDLKRENKMKCRVLQDQLDEALRGLEEQGAVLERFINASSFSKKVEEL